MITVNNASYV